MPTVFVVQNPHRLNRDTHELEPRFDLSSAESYGTLEFLLSPSAHPFAPGHVLPELREKLARYKDGDHLLLIGNPVLIGWAVALAADVDGTVSVLQWSGKEQRYIAIKATVFED